MTYLQHHINSWLLVKVQWASKWLASGIIRADWRGHQSKNKQDKGCLLHTQTSQPSDNQGCHFLNRQICNIK